MSIEIKYPLDNEDNYFFDDTKIEIISSNSKLIATPIGAEAAMYCKLDENEGLVALDSSGNGVHGAFQGGYTENNWTTGKIGSAITGISITNGFINFDQLLSYERTDSFSLECWFKTSSSAVMDLISKVQDSGANQGFILNMLSGKPRTVIRDVNGNIISLTTTLTYNDNNWHHVVFTYDGTNLVTGCNLYVDNVLVNVVESSDTLDSTITGTADLQISGRDGNNVTIDSNTSIDEVVIYSRELSAAEVSFRWNNGNGTQQLPGASTSFPIDNPNLIPTDIIRVGSLNSFQATVVETGSDQIKFVIEVNGVDTYWDGVDWVASTGYAQSNTIAEINTNASSLDLSDGLPIKWKTYYHSNDGSTTPELSEVIMLIDFASGISDVLEQCIVTGTNIDGSGDPDTTPFTVYLNRDAVLYKDQTVILKEIITVTPNSQGDWSVALIENENMDDNSGWIFDFIGATKKVPNELTRKINELDDI